MTRHYKQKSGMCIPYTVRSTPDKGLGVFAEGDVSRGTTVWRHQPGEYEVLDENALTRLLEAGPPEQAVDLLTHIVSMGEFPGYMVRIFDEGALLNHSDQPNVSRKHSAGEYRGAPVTSAPEVARALSDRHFDLVAACDLSAGDELLMDYNDEPDDPGYFEDACERYGVDWEWL